MMVLLITQSAPAGGRGTTYDEIEETASYIMYRSKTDTTRLVLPYPPGAQVGIYRRGNLVLSGKIPLSREIKPGRYDVSVTYGEYVWNGRITVKEGMENVLYVRHLTRKEKEYEEYEDYVVIREPSHRTYLRVKEPTGCGCTVRTERGKTVHRATIPTGRTLKPGFYILEVRCGGRRKRVKVEVKEGMENTVLVKFSGEGPDKKPMSPAAFSKLLKMLEDTPLSEEKYGIVKEAASKNYFASEQVLEILKRFDFEEDRLKVAKLLYPRVVDPENFFIVYEAFEFSSSKEELRRWVEQYEGEKE